MTLYRCVVRNKHGRDLVEQHRDVFDLNDGAEMRNHMRAMLASKNRKPVIGCDVIVAYSTGFTPRRVKEVTA